MAHSNSAFSEAYVYMKDVLYVVPLCIRLEEEYSHVNFHFYKSICR